MIRPTDGGFDMGMKPFRPSLFSVMDSRRWWLRVEPWDRLLFLKMLDIACHAPYGQVGVCSASPGGMWRLAVGHFAPVGAGMSEHDRAIYSINRLIVAGALDELDIPDTRFVYRIVDFELFADALDTHRAISRRYARNRARVLAPVEHRAAS